MIRCIYIFLFLWSISLSFSQGNKKIVFENYVTYQQDEDILKQKGFYQSDIFNGILNADFWITESKKCIRSEQKENYIELSWNKDQDDCDWVGLGFGWENWMGKDLSMINENASIEVIVRTKIGSTSNLPFAFGLEDYAGNQCWLGYQKQFLTKKIIDTSWTTILVPFQLFPAEENSFSFNNVKQMIIQCFASGELQIKSIKIVPASTVSKQEVKLNQFKKYNNVNFENQIGYYTNDSLYFNLVLSDSLTKIDSVIIDLAFASNSLAPKNRTTLLLSDKISTLKCKKGITTNVSGVKMNLLNNKIFLQVSSKWLDKKFLKGSDLYGQIIISAYKGKNLTDKINVFGNSISTSINNPSNWIKFILD